MKYGSGFVGPLSYSSDGKLVSGEDIKGRQQHPPQMDRALMDEAEMVIRALQAHAHNMLAVAVAGAGSGSDTLSTPYTCIINLY